MFKKIMSYTKKMLKKNKKYIPSKQKKKAIRNTALKEIQKIIRQKNKQTKINQIVQLANNFFKTYFSIKYNFTEEELADELKNRKIDPYIKKKIRSILQRISEARYNTDHTNEEINALIQDTKTIIEFL